VGDSSPILTSLKNKTFNIENDQFLIVESGRRFYRSGNGYEYFYSGQVDSNLDVINGIIRWKSMTWIASGCGLYTDSNTILSSNISVNLIDLEENSSLSGNIHITDLAKDNDSLYCCSSDGKVYWLRSGDWIQYQTSLPSLHKIEVIESILIVSSHDRLLAIDLNEKEEEFIAP
jgi:hypothetical protein